MSDQVLEKIRRGEPSFGGWDVLDSFAAVDLLSQAGYDWVALDIEHAAHGVRDVSEMAALLRARGVVPFARVFDKSMPSVRRVADAGIQGIIVPAVSSAADAKEAVDSVKLAPLGKRAIGAGAYAAYGTRSAEAVSHINDDTMVIADIETRDGVENIDEILSVEGIDGIFIGPMDMSYTYGLNGDTQNDTIRQALQTVLASCKAHGKFAGLHIMRNDSAAVRRALEEGYTFIALGFDAHFISSGAEEILASAKAVVSDYNRKNGYHYDKRRYLSHISGAQ